MERRQIFGAAATTLGTTGVAAMIGSLNPAFNADWLMPVGATAAVIGVGIWLILLLTARKSPAASLPTPEKGVIHLGDSYNNNGNNFGHMGPIHNHGPQPRKMDAALKQQILNEMPRDKAITVMALVGDAEACQFAEEIHAFLKANGFPLTEDGISQGIFSGVPKGVSFETGSAQLVVGANF
jgi:hypothetical protein